MLAGISRLAVRRIVRLEAALKGIAGHTGAGIVRCALWSDGRRTTEATLSGIAGLKAEIVLNGAPVGALSCQDGAAAGKLDSRNGAPIPSLCEGDRIEIRQNGVAILRGRLARG